jgi:chromate transporter
VAVHAGLGLVRPSRARAQRRSRWTAYLIAGGVSAALIGPYLVLVLLACGAIELMVQRRAVATTAIAFNPLAAAASTGGVGALAWVAFKVGALAYGGGFVIIPLMQGDAVHSGR